MVFLYDDCVHSTFHSLNVFLSYLLMKGIMKEQKKSKAKNLTDAICRSLPRLDKRYIKQGDYPGLELWVQPGGSKVGIINIESKV